MSLRRLVSASIFLPIVAYALWVMGGEWRSYPEDVVPTPVEIADEAVTPGTSIPSLEAVWQWVWTVHHHVCNNYEFMCLECECVLMPPLSPSGSTAADSGGVPCPKTQSSDTKDQSLIDNVKLNHIHWADEYLAPLGGGAGCAPCGDSGGVSSPVPTLGLRRIHRFREVAFRSSFGPGVFLNLDKQLALTLINADSGVIKCVDYFDPEVKSFLRFVESETPGLFEDRRLRSHATVQLYSRFGVDGQADAVVGLDYDYAAVTHAVVSMRGGGRQVFELLDSGLETLPLFERKSLPAPSPEAVPFAQLTGAITGLGFYVSTRANKRLDNVTLIDTQDQVVYREVFPVGNNSAIEGWRGVRHSRSYENQAAIWVGTDAGPADPVASDPVGSPLTGGFLGWSPKNVGNVLLYTREFRDYPAQQLGQMAFDMRNSRSDDVVYPVLCAMELH